MPDRPSILVVDDDHDERSGICEVLLSAGYDAMGAENGARAMELLQQGLPPLILLDLLMPEKDGWQVLQDLRKSPRSTAVKVVVISAVSSEDLHAPVSGFLAKPFDRDQLLAEVRKHVVDGKLESPSSGGPGDRAAGER
jgi:CheY-like chemotaxis protein